MDVVNKVRDCVATGPQLCEVFNHGQDASNEFGRNGMSVSQIQNLVEQSDQVIRSSLNGYRPRTMVPHANSWGDNLIAALQNMKYNVISASFEEGMTFTMKTDPVHMPQQTETAVFVNGGWVGSNINYILQDCEDAFLAGDAACVIMTHPQEYGSTFTIDQLAQMVELLEKNGWKSKTFNEVAAPYLPTRPTEPPTPAPTPAPTKPWPVVQEWGQCGTTPLTNFGKNCVQGTYCKYGGAWWSSCQSCNTAPAKEDCAEFKAKCNKTTSTCP